MHNFLNINILSLDRQRVKEAYSRFHCFFRFHHVSNLNINNTVVFHSHKIDLFITNSTHINLKTKPAKLDIYRIFQQISYTVCKARI